MDLSTTAFIALGLGFVVTFVSAIMLLVAAFRQSFVWGMVALLVPLGNLVFICLHWADAKKSFFTSLVGMALCVGGLVLAWPQVRAALPNGGLLAMASPSEPPKDLTSQIAERRGQLEIQNAAFATDGADLARQFAELEARRKALKAGDAAGLAQFNADAATYQTRTTRRKEMLAEIQTGQRDLDALLAKRSLAAAQGGAGGRTVVMYTTSRCPACTMAKQYFAQKGVSYQEIDVERSAEGRAAFQQLGGRGVPLIMVGEKRMEGFSAQGLDAML